MATGWGLAEDQKPYQIFVDMTVRIDQVIDQNKHITSLDKYNFKKFSNVYIGNIPDEEKKLFLDNLKKPYLYIGLPDDRKYLNDYEIINNDDLLSSLLIKRSK